VDSSGFGSGIEQWSQTFGGSGFDIGFSVQQTNDGGYIIAGSTTVGNGNEDIYIIKTDASGTEQWSRTSGGGNFERGRSIQQTSDGGYIITGFTNSYGAGDIDVYLIRLGPTTGIISGIITDSLTTNPIPDVKVLTSNIYMPDPVQTAPNGLYIIPEVQPGYGYEVTAFKDGYETKTVSKGTGLDGLTTEVLPAMIYPPSLVC